MLKRLSKNRFLAHPYCFRSRGQLIFRISFMRFMSNGLSTALPVVSILMVYNPLFTKYNFRSTVHQTICIRRHSHFFDFRIFEHLLHPLITHSFSLFLIACRNGEIGGSQVAPMTSIQMKNSVLHPPVGAALPGCHLS